jgi:hypothetical protein
MLSQPVGEQLQRCRSARHHADQYEPKRAGLYHHAGGRDQSDTGNRLHIHILLGWGGKVGASLLEHYTVLLKPDASIR